LCTNTPVKRLINFGGKGTVNPLRSKEERDMRLIFLPFVLLFFVISGCQKQIVNNHGDVKNIEALNSFVKNVDKQSNDELDFVQYGIEGQRGIKTLTFDGEQINVSHAVDGKFIEEYTCNNIDVVNENGMKKYILVDCSFNQNGDFELLSIPLS
jgi:Domain of unknown function (DUF4362)